MSKTTCLMSFNDAWRGASCARARRTFGGRIDAAAASAANLAVFPNMRRRVIFIEPKEEVIPWVTFSVFINECFLALRLGTIKTAIGLLPKSYTGFVGLMIVWPQGNRKRAVHSSCPSCDFFCCLFYQQSILNYKLFRGSDEHSSRLGNGERNIFRPVGI